MFVIVPWVLICLSNCFRVILFIGMIFGCRMFVRIMIKRIPRIVIVNEMWSSFIFVWGIQETKVS